MQIDVISDIVCPWCYIGKRRLERALALRAGETFDVRWRAYQLDPLVPEEGVDRKAYYRAKFGDGERPREMTRALTEMGEAEGIAFDFARQGRYPNTRDAHRLIRWSATTGQQHRMVESLFRRYFVDGEDVGDRAVLMAAAGECGMDTDLVAGLLASDADVALITREVALARQLGIQGVPAYLLANRLLLIGAQDPEVLALAIGRAGSDSALA